MLEDGTCVRHKALGYQGVIDGQTSMKELFTGNKEVSKQYRVLILETKQYQIAPEEDLETIDSALIKFPEKDEGPAPVHGKFKEKSFLMQEGYHLELNSQARRAILVKVIEKHNLYRVVSFLLRSTMYNRTGNSKRVLQNMSCLVQWGSDVQWMMETYQQAPDYNAALKLFEESKKLLFERGYRWQ